MNYQEFLESKICLSSKTGFIVDKSEVNANMPDLFDAENIEKVA